jgi:hypothetical protein
MQVYLIQLYWGIKILKSKSYCLIEVVTKVGLTLRQIKWTKEVQTIITSAMLNMVNKKYNPTNI